MQQLSIPKIQAVIFGIAGIAVAKIKETAVSLVSKLFSGQTRKEGVRSASKPPALAQSSKPTASARIV